VLHNTRQGQRLSALKAAAALLNIFNHSWFDGEFGGHGLIAEHGMVLLLLNVYVSANDGKPLNKSGAMRRMHILHMKTSEKIIKQAISTGLIREKIHPHDKRVTLLFPTPRLERMIDDEMPKLARP